MYFLWVGTSQESLISFAQHGFMVGAVWLMLLAVVISSRHRWSLVTKRLVFGSLLGIVVTISLILLAIAAYTLVKAQSPSLERQAGLEVWACGTQLNLRNPGNIFHHAIGSITSYERDDNIMHVRGPLLSQQAASLGNFFQAIGGQISNKALIVPIEYEAGNDQQIKDFVSSDQGGGVVLRIANGKNCGDNVSEIQTFVYHFDTKAQFYWQEKISDPSNYIIADTANSPPGDCVIVEFAPHKVRTDKLCPGYGRIDRARCQAFGRKSNQLQNCVAQEIPTHMNLEQELRMPGGMN